MSNSKIKHCFQRQTLETPKIEYRSERHNFSPHKHCFSSVIVKGLHKCCCKLCIHQEISCFSLLRFSSNRVNNLITFTTSPYLLILASINDHCPSFALSMSMLTGDFSNGMNVIAWGIQNSDAPLNTSTMTGSWLFCYGICFLPVGGIITESRLILDMPVWLDFFKSLYNFLWRCITHMLLLSIFVETRCFNKFKFGRDANLRCVTFLSNTNSSVNNFGMS